MIFYTKPAFFKLPSLFHNLANIKNDSLYAKAKADRVAFWEAMR